MAEKFYEDDIKEMLLHKQRVFVPTGMKSTVVFEKALVPSKSVNAQKCIADCLIFREDGLIIGLEIKTERDSTQRLNRQLRAYSLVCDYVYVVCHDNHIEKVEQILQRYGHQHVGIVSYVEFKTIPLIGKYREAVRSPLCSTRMALNLLWKQELLSLMSGLRHPGTRIQEELGIASYTAKDRSGGVHGAYVTPSNSMRMKKGQIINNVLARFGEPETKKILCSIFIENRLDPARAVKLRHFYPSQLPREDNNG